MMSSNDLPPPPSPKGVYVPNEIILFGVKLKEIEISKEAVPRSEKLTLRVQLYQNDVLQDEDHYYVAAIYSYAFEGHCYRMDRPRIFIINDVLDEDAEGCGFSDGHRDFRMWRVK